MFKVLIFNLLLVLFTLFSQSASAESCRSVFLQKKVLRATETIEVLFPRRLHIKDHNLNFLLKRSSYKELVKGLGLLFAKIDQQPHFLDQIAEVLVEHVSSSSHVKKTAPLEFIDYFKNNFSLEIKLSEAEAAVKVYNKIQNEMGVGGFSLKEQYLLSYLLHGQKITSMEAEPLSLSKGALSREVEDIFNLKNREPELYELYSKRIRLLQNNINHRKNINNFIISFADWFSSHLSSVDSKIREESLRLTRYNINKKIAIPAMTIQHLLNAISIAIAGTASFSRYDMMQSSKNIENSKDLSRENILNGIEDLILNKMLNFRPDKPLVVDDMIKVIDYILFDPPSPKSGPELRSAVIEKAGNILLPAKAELSKRNAEKTLKEYEDNYSPGMNFVFKTESPSEALRQQKPSGRKRKHSNKRKLSKKKNIDQENIRLEDVIEINPKVDLSLWVKSSENFQARSVEEISSVETYQFFFARDLGRGLQKLKFDQKVLESFANKPKTAQQLIKAIVYGPTSRNSSSAGIKSQAVKSKGDVSFYEARPAGTSANNEGAWRLLLGYDKTTQVWTAKELVPKNMMNKVLIGQ